MSDLFTPGPVPTAAAPVVAPLISRSPLLDAEKLHVYRLAVQFQALANRLVPRQRGELRPRFAISSIAPASRSS